MGQVSFGTVLREARERKGYDVQSAARRLRIRPDILRALENNDFSRLPARGYTRNMVNAYAKLVGLNPADITRMYLDDAYAYQVGRTRGESDSPAHVSGRRSVSRGDGRHDGRGQGSQRSSRYDNERTDGRRSQRTQRGQRQGTQRMPRREQQPQREYRESLASRAARAENESRRSNHFGGAVTTQFTNFYSGSQNNVGRGMQARLPYVAVIVIILLLLVIIVALAFGNRGAASTQEVAKVPITGVTDTSADGSGVSQDNSNNNSDNNNDSDTKSSSTATVPTSVKVEYKLAKGQQAYVIITQDGQATEQMLTGPFDETVDVTGTWSLSTWVSSGFTVTMDGKEVEFTSDATTGMPTATVNFKDYLASWAKDHPDVKVEGLDTSSTSSSTTGSTASTNSTSNGTSAQSSTGNGSSSTGSTTSSTGTGYFSTTGSGTSATGTQSSSSTYSY
ncbi:helix-turn-helix transcriptional regulator [uncultured Senegalimassilia sp.]|mgnify:FL=1|uniref:helix-turn-helix domain-containing protein n=1 Tax=uncultured Senegalimassilia sp. TaxID=1714350 RepID=UPI0025FE7839|nr:helix-turn-helix transcriptional regulator [uncultured Senegalimassilia sp.]